MTIISGEEGLTHCWINQNAKLSLGHADKDINTHYAFNPLNKCLFVHTIEGHIRIGDHTLHKGDALGIWDASSIDIECLEESQFLIIETVINQK